MNEGHQLSEYISRQKKTKKQIANDLSMSRSNLYQIFASQSLEEETKKKFEDYFNDKIFIDNAREKFAELVEIVNDNRRQQPVHYPTFNNDQYTESLKDQIKQLDEHNKFMQKIYEQHLTQLEASVNSLILSLKNDSENLNIVMKEVSVSFRLLSELLTQADPKKGRLFRERFDKLLTSDTA